ncbi:hypothetical protein [Ascidiimonas sp. W6]|uniref:hypothetical protein n=1 Tax=Ascidiimonas meishanensis TaxID=3128903 RepID=UPI0030EF5376
MSLNIYKVIFILSVAMLFSSSAEAQCAMCRAVLQSGESQEAAEGINNGILYLMVIPYVVVGGMCYVVYKLMRPKKN